MRLGSLFKYRHNGKHDDCTLIILPDRKNKSRIVYNMDYKVIVGDKHILFATYTGEVMPRTEIDRLCIEANINGLVLPDPLPGGII